MNVKVKFLGGTETVTGSRFLLDIGDFRLLFDCGLFQGLKELRLRNWEVCPVDPATIHAVVISHAHIDHTGYLPKLVKEGFNGPVYCTEPTADLMELMLLDSAKLQEEEAAFAAKKHYSRHENPLPLYTTEDAQKVLSLVREYPFNVNVKINERIEIIFRNAGHLLGAAITEMFIKGDNQRKKIVFSGDLGRTHDVILNSPASVQEADVLFIESTYGNKDNPMGNPAAELQQIVSDTVANGGVLLIPAFAVGRTQMFMHYLHVLMEEDKIPDVPVYIDSPLATSATYLYYKFPQYHKVKITQSEFARQMETNMLVFVKNSKHSKSLNEIKRNAIIISASGMMTGGRILHHMYHRLKNPADTILIAGYQAEGTRGRRLVDGEPTLRIFGEEIPVHCNVKIMSAFSGHADREELFAWMKNFRKPPKITFTIHGENPDMALYAQAIRDRMRWNVMSPKYLESVELFNGI
ncbi:MAG TPA: MBL fold metallo-hydrolase [Chryseolinea sp.]